MIKNADQTVNLILQKAYGVTPDVLEKSAWGFNSTAYYFRQGDDQFVAKVTLSDPEKLAKCQKDVQLSMALANIVPTSTFIPNKNGDFITQDGGFIVRVARFVAGAPPFDMNSRVYKSMLDQLRKFHLVPLADLLPVIKPLKLPVLEGSKTFLHGDLTPSNVIVAGDKIQAVLDFEDSLIGPVEYDLARCAVFSWFRWQQADFEQVFHETLTGYGNRIDQTKLADYCQRHVQEYLEHIVEYKAKYDNLTNWTDDYNFARQSAAAIESFTSQFSQV